MKDVPMDNGVGADDKAEEGTKEDADEQNLEEVEYDSSAAGLDTENEPGPEDDQADEEADAAPISCIGTHLEANYIDEERYDVMLERQEQALMKQARAQQNTGFQDASRGQKRINRDVHREYAVYRAAENFLVEDVDVNEGRYQREPEVKEYQGDSNEGGNEHDSEDLGDDEDEDD